MLYNYYFTLFAYVQSIFNPRRDECINLKLVLEFLSTEFLPRNDNNNDRRTINNCPYDSQKFLAGSENR